MSKLEPLIEKYAEAREVREQAAALTKAAAELEDLAEAALFDLMETQGLRSVRHKTLGLFSLNDLAWAKVSDEAVARAWAEATMPEIITLNRQRLSVVVRESLRGERDMPPGVEFSTTRNISWRRGG